MLIQMHCKDTIADTAAFHQADPTADQLQSVSAPTDTETKLKQIPNICHRYACLMLHKRANTQAQACMMLHKPVRTHALVYKRAHSLQEHKQFPKLNV